MPSNTPLDYVTLFIVIKLEMSLKFQITFTLMQMLHGKPSFLAVTAFLVGLAHQFLSAATLSQVWSGF